VRERHRELIARVGDQHGIRDEQGAHQEQKETAR